MRSGGQGGTIGGRAVTTANVAAIAKSVVTTLPPPPPPAGGAAGRGGRGPVSGTGAGAVGSRRTPSSGPAATSTVTTSTASTVKQASSSSAPTSHQQQQHEQRISARKLDPNKFANPFATNTKKCKSTFSSSYVNNSIPCRLQTTASRYYLQWDKGAETGFSLDLLAVCADGLLETDHPFVIMAPLMFHELCVRSEGCAELFLPQAVENIVGHIRAAMVTAAPCGVSGGGGGSSSAGASGVTTFDNALRALVVLMEFAKQAVVSHFAKLIPVLARVFAAPIATAAGGGGAQASKRKEAVAEALRAMEALGGVEVTKQIKSKIPTY